VFTFKIAPDDGEPFTVTATARDVLTWERTTKGRTFGAMSDSASLRMEDLYKLAWIASCRTGRWQGTLPDFERTVDVDLVDEEEPDPTRPAP